MSALAPQPQPAPALFADPKRPAAQVPATRQLALLYAHRLLAGTSLRFGLMLHLSSPLRSLLAYYGNVDLRLCAEIAAAATDLPFSAILSILRPSSRLRQMRLFYTAE